MKVTGILCKDKGKGGDGVALNARMAILKSTVKLCKKDLKGMIEYE